MASHHLPDEPRQMLPWPGGHLAHFIGDTVDMLDLSAFQARHVNPHQSFGKPR